jgi:signal transduction histidine kinase
VFGVHPWTVALVLVSVVTAARWPVLAADLVPVLLTAFAVRGFMIAASWQSLPPGLIRAALPYGGILVRGRQSVMLAGAEASAFPEAALALVAEARETSLRALGDLRDLVRGICPPVLADRGLGHAVRALALDTPFPVDLDIDLPGRLTTPVESACYFAVAEALANAVRHSGARRVHIRMQHTGGLLRVQVADDGAGGADPARGSRLRGVEQRLGAFDGILAVSSPPGGPTMIAMEVPCALSSPKTCSC